MNFVQPIRDVEKVREVREILAESSPRNELLFCIGIYTGLRISDILRLRVRDVRNRQYVTIKEMKTKKTKRFPIVRDLEKALEPYIEGKPDQEYLFKSRQGKNKPITRVRAYEILRVAAKTADLREIGTHTLRKTFGYHLYQATKDVAMLQDILNHSDPYITLKYIGVNQDAIDAAVKKLKY